MSRETLEEYAAKNNIDRIIQDFGNEQGIGLFIVEKEGYYTEIEVIAVISDYLWINYFEEKPEEWLDFVYEDIAKSELKARAGRLQETLTTLYVENEVHYMEGELTKYIYDDYCKWYEESLEEEPDYGSFEITVKILVNYDTAFIAEDLIDARRIIRDNM